MEVLGLLSLSLEVAVAQDIGEIGQQIIKLTIQILHRRQHIRILIPRILRFVGHRLKLQLHPFDPILFNLILQHRLLSGLRRNLNNFVLFLIKSQINEIPQRKVTIDDEVNSNYLFDVAPVVVLEGGIAQGDDDGHGVFEGVEQGF